MRELYLYYAGVATIITGVLMLTTKEPRREGKRPGQEEAGEGTLEGSAAGGAKAELLAAPAGSCIGVDSRNELSSEHAILTGEPPHLQRPVGQARAGRRKASSTNN